MEMTKKMFNDNSSLNKIQLSNSIFSLVKYHWIRFISFIVISFFIIVLYSSLLFGSSFDLNFLVLILLSIAIILNMLSGILQKRQESRFLREYEYSSLITSNAEFQKVWKLFNTHSTLQFSSIFCYSICGTLGLFLVSDSGYFDFDYFSFGWILILGFLVFIVMLSHRIVGFIAFIKLGNLINSSYYQYPPQSIRYQIKSNFATVKIGYLLYALGAVFVGISLFAVIIILIGKIMVLISLSKIGKLCPQLFDRQPHHQVFQQPYQQSYQQSYQQQTNITYLPQANTTFHQPMHHTPNYSPLNTVPKHQFNVPVRYCDQCGGPIFDLISKFCRNCGKHL